MSNSLICTIIIVDVGGSGLNNTEKNFAP